MSAPTSAVKRRFNKNKYRRFDTYIDRDSKLAAILERHINAGGKISELIKLSLCEHYGISTAEGNMTYSDYYLSPSGEQIQRHELDEIMSKAANNNALNNTRGS